MGNQRKPKKIDEYAGSYLRHKRNAANITQQMVADNVGVTFQQIQKVEKGANRMSVSGFIMYCRAIGVKPSTAMREIEKIAGENNENV